MSESHSGPVQFELPRPGPQHRLLEPFAGVWRAEVEIFMGGENPHKSTGTMTNSWVVDGLYLEQVYQGDVVSAGYPAFVGRGFWGYNFGAKQYEGFWIDNASSVMQTESGTVDETGKIWTMFSSIHNPVDGRSIRRRNTIRLESQDLHSMETHMSGPDGKSQLSMRIQYRRAD